MVGFGFGLGLGLGLAARTFLPMNSSASAGVLIPSEVHSCSDAAIA